MSWLWKDKKTEQLKSRQKMTQKTRDTCVTLPSRMFRRGMTGSVELRSSKTKPCSSFFSSSCSSVSLASPISLYVRSPTLRQSLPSYSFSLDGKLAVCRFDKAVSGKNECGPTSARITPEVKKERRRLRFCGRSQSVSQSIYFTRIT